MQAVYSSSIIMGIGTHIGGQDIDKNILTSRQMGMASVRDDFSWKSVELTQGVLAVPAKLGSYNASLSSAGISPLMILDYGNPYYDGGGKPVTDAGINAFVNYARFTVSSLSAEANYFEIWNEWDHGQAPTTPASYLNLVKATAPAIKAANGSSLVLAGSVTTAAIRAGWLDQLVQQGVLDYVDGVSIHPYIHCDPDSRPEAWISFLNSISTRLQSLNGNKQVPIYITEMGWPSDTGGCGNTPETVGKYIARAALLVRTVPSVRGLWWYDIINDGQDPTNREQNFGMMNYDYTPKPAFNALKDEASVISNGRKFAILAAPAGVVLMEIADAAGNKVFAVWTDNKATAQASLALTPATGATITSQQVGSGTQQGVSFANGQANLTITDNPLLIFGAATLSVSAAQ
jgi:hypothetical protein